MESELDQNNPILPDIDPDEFTPDEADISEAERLVRIKKIVEDYL